MDIPGRGELRLEHAVLDVNGTITGRGDLVAGVPDRLARLARTLEVRLLSADTLGTLETVAAAVGVRAEQVESGADKARFVERLGTERCVAIGNGANDTAMLEASALGIAVVGPEGAATAVVHAADVVCASIVDALDLLLDTRALIATLRP